MGIALISLAYALVGGQRKIKIMATTTTTTPKWEWKDDAASSATADEFGRSSTKLRTHNFAIVCMVCRYRFGDRRFLAHPTNAKMHRLICPSCIKGKAMRRLYKDPEYKAAIMAMLERERMKKQQKKTQPLQTAAVVVVIAATPSIVQGAPSFAATAIPVAQKNKIVL